MRSVRTATLEIAYLEAGPVDGAPMILLHGFPDDVHAYEAVAPALAAAERRLLVPWLRGYGPTRFRHAAYPALRPAGGAGGRLAGLHGRARHRPGGARRLRLGWRACCIVAALWPHRVRGLVSVNGWNIQDIATANHPAAPEQELRYWYQWYLQTERGRAGMAAHRREIGRLLWRRWSPNWAFDDETFDRTAASWDNPDYVAVVVHSYRHRYGAAPGDPALEPIERSLVTQPCIAVPTVVLDGMADGVRPPTVEDRHVAMFTGPYRRLLVPRADHFLPREAPQVVVDAVLSLSGG